MLKKKKYLLGLGIIMTLLVLPVVSYYAVPTFKKKVANTMHDLSKTNSEYAANNQSMTGRVYSYKVGWDIVKRNPLFGVGAGNIYHEVKKTYAKKFPSIKPHMRLQPHNQYLRYLSVFGIIGFTVFLISFYAPFFYRGNWKLDPFLVLQLVMVTSSFLFEGTIETQLGTNYAIIFTLLPVYFIDSNRAYLSTLSEPWLDELES